MAATEIITNITGTLFGRDIHVPTGEKGLTFTNVHDWVADKQKAGISVHDATTNVLVSGVSQWAAYIEVVNDNHDFIIHIFEVT
jgi:hypothetical protein